MAEDKETGTGVFSWGYGDMLALGHGLERDEKHPREIDLGKVYVKGGGNGGGGSSCLKAEDILTVDAGWQHSMFLTRQP